MLSKFAKLALVGTSFAPVLLAMAYIRALDGRWLPHALAYFSAASLLVIIALSLITVARKQLEIIPFHPTSVRTADTEIVGFVLAYLLPFVDASGVAIRPEVFWFVMTLLAVVVWSTNAYHVNPLLGLLGFHFYDVSSDSNVSFVLITRRNLRESGTVEKVVQLTEYMVLDMRSR